MTTTLSNCRVLVTRANHQSAAFTAELQERGAAVIELPLITILPPDDWQPLDQAFAEIASFDWVVFASANAVHACLARWQELYATTPPGSHWHHLKFACIGPKTKTALESYQLTATLTPHTYIAEGLVTAFPGYPDLSGLKILWPRTNIGRLFMYEEFTKLGASVHLATCYQTAGPSDPAAAAARLSDLISSKQINVITLASSQTVKNLKALLDQCALPAIPDHIIICTIGPETSATARRLLGRADVESDQYTTTGMIDSLSRYISRNDVTP